MEVNYTTFASNEDMYAKLKSGAVSYDVIIPSDYMIARLAEEDMLLPLNFDNIPNYQYIAEEFAGCTMTPDDQLLHSLHLRGGGHHLSTPTRWTRPTWAPGT